VLVIELLLHPPPFLGLEGKERNGGREANREGEERKKGIVQQQQQ
jgi:hypothetical protein